MIPWIPVEQPYRVLRTRQFRGEWSHSDPQMFATEAEARAEFDKPFQRHESEVVIDQAVNPETWRQNGRWQKVAERKRGSK